MHFKQYIYKQNIQFWFLDLFTCSIISSWNLDGLYEISILYHNTHFEYLSLYQMPNVVSTKPRKLSEVSPSCFVKPVYFVQHQQFLCSCGCWRPISPNTWRWSPKEMGKKGDGHFRSWCLRQPKWRGFMRCSAFICKARSAPVCACQIYHGVTAQCKKSMPSSSWKSK